jgi:hypothetical protein
MAKTAEARTVSVSINRSPNEVYQFLAEPENFPQWASGLGHAIRRHGDSWRVKTLHGEVTVRFSEPNPYGIVDHTVYPDEGNEIYVPMRVVANSAGCEVLLTLFRQPGMTDAKFGEDAQWVERDLQTLKNKLEK